MLTALLLVVLMVGYYLVSVFYTKNIIGGLENIKEHPFPVVIAAGDMKTNSLQIRLMVDRLSTDRAEEALEDTRIGFAENQQTSRQALDILVELYLTDANAAEKIDAQYNEVMRQQEILLGLCETENTTNEEVRAFADEHIIPVSYTHLGGQYAFVEQTA